MSTPKVLRRNRHARVAHPHAFDSPDEGGILERAMMPRFSPTAIFSNSASSSASAPPASPTSSVVDVPPTTPATSSTPTPTTPAASTSSPASTPSSSADTSSSTSTSSPTSTSSSSSPAASSSVPVVASAPILVPTSSRPLVVPSTTPLLVPSVAVPGITQTITAGSSSTLSSPTASATAAPSGGTSTSAIVGGIAGGLVGVAGLFIIIMYFVRRARKNSEDEDFSADAFRRQSAILMDDDAPPFAGAGGSGSGRSRARPPTMIERHVANNTAYDAPPAMPGLQQYQSPSGMPGPGAGAFGYPGGLARQPSFSPGQVIPTSPAPVHSPYDVYSDPGQQQQLHRQPSHAGAIYNEYGQLVRQPSSAGYPDLHRQPSSAGYPDLHRQPSGAGYPDLNRQDSLGAAHYVDLDRSSVTPFQAQQYAEISRRLHVEAPAGAGPGLNAVSEDDEPSSRASDTFPGAAAAGPFDDPRGQSLDVLPNPFDREEHIVPPSPVYSMGPHAAASRERILSQPPTLPEIQVPTERAFSPSSYDFPQTPGAGARPSPSPLHSAFTLAPPPAAVLARDPVPQQERPVSSYTMYDEEDAYGGM